MSLFSVKMRAAAGGAHISGAERIVSFNEIAASVEKLTARALSHPKGQPDTLNIKVEAVPEPILRVPALRVQEIPSASTAETDAFLHSFLLKNGWDLAALRLLRNVRGLRGAMLIDAHSGARLDTNLERGVRVSCMDHAHSGSAKDSGNAETKGKQHFTEALALASKVCAHPNIVAELCISDDPDYTTGYLAHAGTYYRLRNCKELGSPSGTRVFLYDGPEAELASTIDYLENTPVLVEPRQ
ncbi:6-carboxyhexanoate--CoA ligase [Corynebacterium sp. H127]|uniref:6-carboxyhexanoate--CoA ligase n=1 Tax=Corynebacterium sp. H127 TaxID=3133418 RepID=UPI0030B54030